MVHRFVWFAWQKVSEHGARLVIFGLIGYSIAIPRAASLGWMVSVGWNETGANLTSLVASVLIAYLFHYHVTWRKSLSPLPVFSRRNLTRLGVLLPGFMLIVIGSVIVRLVAQPVIHPAVGLALGWVLILSPAWVASITALFLDSTIGLLDYFLHNEVTFKRAEQYAARLWPRLVASYAVADY